MPKIFKKRQNISLTKESFKNGCPICGCEDKFLLGPRGGLSRMVKCDNCGTEFVFYPTGQVEIVKR